MDWSKFEPTDFEYDFERDELYAHRITFKEAVECFYNDFEVRRNKSFKDRFQLIGKTFGGRTLKIIFQLKTDRIVRIDNYRLGHLMQNLTEKEIDELVVSEVNNDFAWEQPIRVNRKPAFSISSHIPEIFTGTTVLGGEPVFHGTKVPVSELIDNIEAGASLDEFLDKFPAVRREQVIGVLEIFRTSLHRLKTV